jgi:transposase-like protein
MYLYRAIDSHGDTVEFWFSERRNLTAAKQFLRKALPWGVSGYSVELCQACDAPT